MKPESGLAEMAAEMGWLGAVAVLPAVLVSQVFSSPLLEEAGWRIFNSVDGNLFSMLLFHASLNTSLNVLLPHQTGWTSSFVVCGAALGVVLVLGFKNLSRHQRYAGCP